MTDRTPNSQRLFARAQQHIPGGVNSPVRAFRSVGGTPLFFKRGAGPHLWDADGNRYIDFVGSWGPAVLGHAHPEVVAAVQAAAADGLSFGAPTERESEMAELLCRLMPSIEQVRLVSSGTEATMSAIRLARGYTGRTSIVKFAGCYHGHADSLLVKAGSGLLTFGQPTSAGVPQEVAQLTRVLDYNALEPLQTLFETQGDSIAAVIIEPIAGNMNMVIPSREFLQGLRSLCTQYGAVLIFDEVMTGFRVGLHGATGHFGVTPDLITLGKVIGGGLPVGAFGGRRDIMSQLAPVGPVYQAGTLSGNPVALAAGLSTLKLVQQPGFYEALHSNTQHWVQGLQHLGQQHGMALCGISLGGMFGMYCASQVPATLAEVEATNREQFNSLFHAALQEGVYLAPSAFEAGFVSAAHTAEVIDTALAALARAMERVKGIEPSS